MERKDEYTMLFFFVCLLTSAVILAFVSAPPSARAEVATLRAAMNQNVAALTDEIGTESTTRFVADSQLSKEHTALAWRVNTLEHAPTISSAASGNVTVLAWCATIMPPNGTFEATCER